MASKTSFYSNSGVKSEHTDAIEAAIANAEHNASLANDSAVSANSSLISAQASQAHAETAETNAETAQAASEAARDASIVAKDQSVVAKVASETAKTASQTAKTLAETAAVNAANSATSATTNGAYQVSLATDQVTLATTQANLATTNGAAQVALATTQVGIATTKANEASSSAASAQASKDAALAALDSFDDRYLGQKSSNPTVDNDGNTLVAGSLFFDTTSDVMKVYEGSSWVAAYASLSGALIAASNLADLPSASAARTNLGLGTVATTASTAYATAAQGTKADNALPKAGGTLTGDLSFGDNDKAIFGAGSDLQIYHDPANGSIVKDNGVGRLLLDSENGTGISLTSGGIAKTMIGATKDGDVKLYYDGSLKLATTSTGIDVTGTAVTDGLTVAQGSGANILLESTTTGATAGDIFGEIEFKTNDSNSSGIKGKIDSYSEGAVGNGALRLFTGDTTGLYQRLNIASNGDISFYEDTGTTAKLTWDSSAESLNFADNGKAIFGAGSDLQIYHDGSNSHIQEVGTGNLTISGTSINFNNNDLGGRYAEFVSNGAVKLFNAGAQKLETTATGIDVTGNATFADNGKAIFGAGSDLQIYHDGADTLLVNTTGDLEIRGAGAGVGNLLLRPKAGENGVIVKPDGAVELYHNNSKTFETTSDGVTVTGTLTTGIINGGNLRGEAWIIGRDDNDYIAVDANKIDFSLDDNIDMRLENDGDLHVDGNVIAYSTTTSDERLKKDIVKIDNALDKVSQLSGYTFEYIADGKKSAGVIAQEVEKVMPSAVSETTLPLKMGEDDKTEYKTVQYDQLHGLMIEAIKELKAEIEELKNGSTK
tara:strand:+ start:907 stop:3402 length:2496 start_codon:yes stop_codon:yes gene_type:complete